MQSMWLIMHINSKWQFNCIRKKQDGVCDYVNLFMNENVFNCHIVGVVPRSTCNPSLRASHKPLCPTPFRFC